MAHRKQVRNNRTVNSPASLVGSLPRTPCWAGLMLHFGKSLLIGASVMGSIAGGYTCIRPDVSVEPYVYWNEREPFSVQFRVTNLGLLPLYDMTFSCRVDTPPLHNVVLTNFRDGQFPVSRLSSKESTITSCPALFGLRPLPGDMQIIISARAPGWWGRQTWKTRFVSRPDAHGVFRWFPQPVDH